MKRPPLTASAPANDDALALPPLAASRAGRTLAVLLEIEDPRRDHIRVALDAFGAVAGSGVVSGTVH